MMDKSEKQIRRIVVERMDRCSVCHRSFIEDDVEVVSRKEDIWMMVVQCKDCHSRAFVAALVGEATATSPMGQLFDPAATNHPFDALEDVTSADVETAPVNVDDVLAMHEFLESFDGDFRGFLRRSTNR